MADVTWPPALFSYLNMDSWPSNAISNFGRQLIPLIDAFHWAHTVGKDIIQVIPHHYPEFRATVYGQVEPKAGKNASAGLVAVPLGEVGYDAVDRRVIIATNKMGGTGDTELRIPVSVVLPLIMQALTMIPWSWIDEVDAASAEQGGGLPNMANIGVWVYEKARKVLAGIGINAPAAPGGGIKPAKQTAAEMIVLGKGSDPQVGPSGKYILKTDGFEYELFIPADIELLPQGRSDKFVVEASTVGFDEGIAGNGTFSCDWKAFNIDNDGVIGWDVDKFEARISSNVPVEAVGDPGDPDYIPPIPGNTVMGEDEIIAAKAIRWMAVTNNGPADVVIDSGTYVYDEGPWRYLMDVPAPHTIAPGDTWQWMMYGETAGKDNSWRDSGTVWLNSFTPLLGLDPMNPGAEDWLSAEFYSDPVVNGDLDSYPGVDYYPGKKGSCEVVLCNLKDMSSYLLPSLATWLLNNIPVMDLSQWLYMLVDEVIELITHHPPPFTKRVVAGGSWVQFRYQLNDGEKRDTLPPPEAVMGRTLNVYALFKTSRSAAVGETLLVSKTFTMGHGAFTAADGSTSPGTPYILNMEANDAGFDLEPRAVGYAYELDGYPGASITITSFTNGTDEVPATPDTPAIPATKGRLTGTVTVTNGFPPTSISPTSMKLLGGVGAVTLNNVPAGVMAALPVVEAPLTFGSSPDYPWLEVRYLGPEPGHAGKPMPDGAEAGEAGEAGLACLQFCNTTASVETIPSIPADWEITIDLPGLPGVNFLVGAVLAALDWSELVVPGTVSAYPFTGVDSPVHGTDPVTLAGGSYPITAIEFHAASTVFDHKGFFHRWLPPDLMTYVGSGVGLNLDFINPANVKGLPAYLAGRIRWQINKPGDIVWHSTSSTDEEPVPVNYCEVATITYDAVKRTVRINDLLEGGTVEMRLNAVIWFMLRLIMMVPVDVF